MDLVSYIKKYRHDQELLLKMFEGKDQELFLNSFGHYCSVGGRLSAINSLIDALESGEIDDYRIAIHIEKEIRRTDS